MTETNALLDQIRGFHENQDNGVLTLSKNGHRMDVFYREGMIEAVSSNVESHRLGDYLTRETHLTDRDVQTVLGDMRRNKTLFGEAAVRRRLLDPAELSDVVRRQ